MRKDICTPRSNIDLYFLKRYFNKLEKGCIVMAELFPLKFPFLIFLLI
jgi:hypothetical protein